MICLRDGIRPTSFSCRRYGIRFTRPHAEGLGAFKQTMLGWVPWNNLVFKTTASCGSRTGTWRRRRRCGATARRRTVRGRGVAARTAPAARDAGGLHVGGTFSHPLIAVSVARAAAFSARGRRDLSSNAASDLDVAFLAPVDVRRARRRRSSADARRAAVSQRIADAALSATRRRRTSPRARSSACSSPRRRRRRHVAATSGRGAHRRGMAVDRKRDVTVATRAGGASVDCQDGIYRCSSRGDG
jgi:hypothetical protein